MDTKVITNEPASRTLVQFYERNGCLRQPNPNRQKKETGTYKMGYEIRLVALSKRELTEIRRAIREVGLKAGKPFAKGNRWIQPIYGRGAMDQFVAWIKHFGVAQQKKLPVKKRKAAGKKAAAR